MAELQAAVSTGYSRGKFEGLLDQPVSVTGAARTAQNYQCCDCRLRDERTIHDAGRHVDFAVIGVGNGDAMGTLLGLAAGRTAQSGTRVGWRG